MYYQTQIPFIFVFFFSDKGQCFCSAQTRASKIKKSGYTGIILDNIPYFQYIFQAFTLAGVCCRRTTDRRQMTDERQQIEFRNYRQTDISQSCLKRAYIWSMKIPKNRKKFKGRPITCSYTEHVNVSHIQCIFGENMCFQSQMLLIFVIFFQTLTLARADHLPKKLPPKS